MSSHSRSLLAACTVLTAACAAGDASVRWDGTIETLPNGVVRVTNGAGGLWPSGEEWVLVPELRLGALDGTGPDAFGGVAGLEADADGRIYVLDRQDNEVRIFDDAGRHLRSFGRVGQGPGEFVAANGMEWLAPDTLLVADGRNQRYSLFTRDGEFVRSMPRSLSFFGFVMAGATVGRTLYEQGSLYRTADDNEPVFFAMRIGAGVEAMDTLPAPWTYAPRYPSLSVRTNGAGMVIGVPFAPGPTWHLDGRGSLWYGHTDDYRIYQLDMAGDTIREIVAPAAPHPVLPHELDEWEATTGVQRFVEMGGRIDRRALPREKPVFSALLTDADGHLWVEVPDADGVSRFDIFDADGRRLGMVATDVRRVAWVRPRLHGDRLYLVGRDEYDVERVVVYRIEKERR